MRNKNPYSFPTFADVKVWWGFVKHWLFDVEDTVLSRKTTHKVLWSLIDEIPTQMRETYKIILGSQLPFLKQEGWLDRFYQGKFPFTELYEVTVSLRAKICTKFPSLISVQLLDGTMRGISYQWEEADVDVTLKIAIRPDSSQ